MSWRLRAGSRWAGGCGQEADGLAAAGRKQMGWRLWAGNRWAGGCMPEVSVSPGVQPQR
ncbi:MAG: hypothetical protein SPL65_05285 [Lachnospiraceae bacterium]|nr:hypothetical protein [Lachnospiraceae bacterium]